ncbi:MAG: TonB-dependent receptor [Chitinophagaceae bacterium]|nr:TonB-dependent receptor [Chitinophagaceae bacterium]
MRKFLLLSAMLLLLLTSQAQNRNVSGKVTDDKGRPVQGASVLAKGSRRGVTTNTDGSFSLSVPPNTKSLLISSIDMTTQDVAINASGNVTVTLIPKSGNLEEVVIVGYGTQKKALTTGSINTVKAAEVENKPFTSIDKGLQGLVPGLQSVAGSGAPGSTQDIRIRGISSINAGNAPLWVIDGAIINTGDASRLATTANLLSTLNPNDIESITVLKDASSTSIYGSRGANGVIIITTKKGRAGKTRFRFDAEVGQDNTAYQNDRYRPLNASEYINITREGLVNAGVAQASIDATLTALGNGNKTDYNWLDAVTRQGQQQQYNISASGGGDKTTFYLSGGYFKQQGTVIGSDLKRYNAAIRVSNQATSRLNISVNFDGGFVQQNTPLAGGAFGNPVLSSYFILPTRSAYKPDGSLNILTPDFPTSSVFNTVAITKLDKRFLKEFSLRGSASAEYKILNNLIFKSNYGADFDDLEEDQYNNPFYGDGATFLPGSPTFGNNILYNPSTTGRAFAYVTRYYNYTWTNTLSLHQNILKNGDAYVNVKVGYENQKSQGYLTSLQNTGFPLTLALQYPASAATPKTASATISEYSFVSQFSTADFSYQDKYILSGSYRRDGSSRFSPNHKYGNFWSIGASWNVNKEKFMESIPVIDQLKLRASYGKVGNASIGNYDYFPGYGFGFNYNSTPGSAPNNVGNSELTWENNRPLDLGLDVSVLKNRANFTFDYYKRISSDLLLDVPLSATSGFASVRQNVGKLQNAGVELSLNLIPVQTRDFNWIVDFNYSHNLNRVLVLPNKNADIPSPVSTAFLIRQGYDVQSFFVRQYAGVDPNNGDPLWYTDSSKKAKQNVYSTAKRILFGSASPTFFGSLTNTLNYKGFSLQAQLYYSGGNYVQTGFESFFIGAGVNPTFNKVARVLDRWQKPGDVTDIPKYIYNGNKSFQSFSTFYLHRGDFIRLRNVQLGYTLPQTVISRLNITNAFFYVRGTNLATWVKDKNLPFDPEQGITSVSNLNVFVPRTVTVGINLGF